MSELNDSRRPADQVDRRLRAYFEHSMVGMATTSPGKGWIDVNPALRGMLGYSAEELSRMTWAELTHPEDLDTDLSQFNRLLSGDIDDYKMDKRFIRKDGDVVYAHLAVRAIRDSEGGLDYVIALVEDITQHHKAGEEFAKSRNRYQGILHNMMDAYYRVDMNGRILETNPATSRMHGYSMEELLQMSVSDLEVIESAEDTRKHIETIRRKGHDFFESKHRCKDGRIIDIEVSANVSIDNPGNVDAFYRDITESKKAESQLRLAASVFANSFDGLMITNTDNMIIDVNPAFTRITGYARDEIVGKNPRVLSSGRQAPAFYAEMWLSLAEKGFWRGEIWNRRKTGEVYTEMLAISVAHDDAGKLRHYIAAFSDISSLKKHQDDLDRIAHYDTLTGVPNRRLLADRLGQAIAHARRSGNLLALCYLDLDSFKPINDKYGHQIGDQVLVEISKRLQSLLRENDTLARLGGDEFVLLLNDLRRPEECYGVLDRILTASRVPVMINDVPVNISTSIGVCLCPPDELDADTLLRHSDQAMYRAKEAGKNRYHLFDPEQDRQIKAHHHQLRRLREALEKNEFVLHYQPKANLATGEVVGAEALIRWQHPEEGLLAPGVFLHHLEGTDLEFDLGEWTIESVLQQMESWKAAGLTMVVSVNISANHLLQRDFTERLRLALERHPEIAPGKLELEILETAALSDMELATSTLYACRDLGVRFALDDFGTGYSSLSYFRNLPVDILKIDQSFVIDMLEDPNDLDIVESIVNLAQVFNRPVIAEGVETLAHGSILMLLGCPLCQGYGIARPMPPRQLSAWIDQWHGQAAWSGLDRRVNAREDLPLMVAAKSHRKWIEQLAKILDNPDGQTTLELDPRHCRFGRWYIGSGTTRYGGLPEFQAIHPIHERVHVLGAELLELVYNGQSEMVRERLPELYGIRDSLLQQIDVLVERVAKLSAD